MTDTDLAWTEEVTHHPTGDTTLTLTVVHTPTGTTIHETALNTSHFRLRRIALERLERKLD